MPLTVAVIAGVIRAVVDLDAAHYPDPELRGRGGCVMCWPKDGSWPCTSRMVADELRSLLEDEDVLDAIGDIDGQGSDW